MLSFAVAVGLAGAGCGTKETKKSSRKPDKEDEDEDDKPSKKKPSKEKTPEGPLVEFAEFTSKAAGYTMLFPKGPKLESETLTLGGKPSLFETVSAEVGKITYFVQWFQSYPNSTDADVLSKQSQTVIKRLGYELVETKNAKVGKYAALDSSARHPKDGALFVRTFVIDGGLFSLNAAGVPESAAKGWFDTFKRIET